MSLLNRYRDFIRKKQLFQPTEVLLLAVSGGVDSVVLCHLCKEEGCQFAIAHCNFQLRGEESERDEEFVRNLAGELRVPFCVNKFDTAGYAERKHISIQVAARELRYNWFYQILNGQWEDHKEGMGLISHPKYSFIVTAHHSDDNIETVLMNFCKGTGITGLRGIQPKNGKLVRPLLFATKEEVLDYAKANGLKWIEDSSNAEAKYSRNYFRRTIIPAIEKVYPDLKNNIVDNINRFNDVHDLYQQVIEGYKNRLLEPRGREVYISLLKLVKSHPLHTIIYELTKDFGFSSQQVAEVEKLLASKSGKYIVSATHRILKDRAWLIVSPLQAAEQEIIIIEKAETEKFFNNKALRLKWLKGKDIHISPDRNIALLDTKKVQFPLILRKWKQGDYFYPLGMRKKKKLSRFFIDQKLPLSKKEKVWVVESHKKIIWVIGYRIDDRFKIDEDTCEALQLSTATL